MVGESIGFLPIPIQISTANAIIKTKATTVTWNKNKNKSLKKSLLIYTRPPHCGKCNAVFGDRVM